MPASVLCVIDCRHQVDKSYFEKEILQSLCGDVFETFDFVFILPDESSKKKLGGFGEYWVARPGSTLEDFFTFIEEKISNFSHILFAENEVFPDKNFFKKLATAKDEQVCVPANIIALDKSEYLYFDQRKFARNREWKSGLFFCIGFKWTQKLKWLEKRSFENEIFSDLAESLFQIFMENKASLSVLDNTWAFAQSDCASYQRAVGESRSMAYFSKTKTQSRFPFRSPLEKYNLHQETRHKKNVTQNLDFELQIKAAAQLDPRWQRVGTATLQVHEREPSFYAEHELYELLSQQMQNSSYVVLLHQLRRGGAEKEAILHLKAYCQIFPKNKVSLVITSPVEPDLAWQLPEAVEIVEFGKLTSHLPDLSVRDYLLFRVLNKIRPTIIHNNCSRDAWKIFVTYGRQLAQYSKLWGSLYCVDYRGDGFSASYAFEYLFGAAEHLDCLLLDNQHFLDQLRTMVPLKSSRKLFYPVEEHQANWSAPRQGPLKIFWSARLSFQKDLQTLLGAVWLFPEIEFHVYGEISESESDILMLGKQKNVVLWGAFDGIDDIDVNQYDAFLYTTLWDGLPNILLEVGARGLPVISPRVCGIPEILNNENSFLYDDLSELSKILENWKSHSKYAVQKGAKLKENIYKKHSWSQFIEHCKELYE
jgi:glycosyltransferase involved in cell wall biosynthesis